MSSIYFLHRGWPLQKITHPGAADESALENSRQGKPNVSGDIE
jgi:hypothetical protein